jgi:hypothetical protein
VDFTPVAIRTRLGSFDAEEVTLADTVGFKTQLLEVSSPLGTVHVAELLHAVLRRPD